MVTGWEPWRIEADDEWLFSHSGGAFARVRRVFHPLSGTADAVSHSVLGGILGGAPRNPGLKVRGVQAEQIRYAEQHYAYATVHVDVVTCPRCGYRLEEQHRLMMVTTDGRRGEFGRARACRACDAGSWMFESQMPSAKRLRARNAKVVL